MNKITERIKAANQTGRKALIPFLPAGFPDKDRFWNELDALDKSGADVIEIGVPFSDPVADGPVVEEASLECLERGVTLSWIIEGLRARKGTINAGLVLMGYYNPFLQYGLERFAADAADAQVNGVIVPDMPLDESKPFHDALAGKGLALIPLVGLNTGVNRMRAYAEQVGTEGGFVYMVSVLGITGERDNLPKAIAAKLGEARQAFDLPLALGFGIKSPEQLAPFGDNLDAVVFGSALITHIRSGGDARGFMSRWI